MSDNVTHQEVPCEVTPEKNVGILPCSGACNVGQMTAKAVIAMTERHKNINFVCALGLPLGIPGIIANGKKADHFIALNGCDVRCSSKALASAEIPVDREVVVTHDLGIAKNKKFRDEEGLDKLLAKTEEFVRELSHK